MAKALLGELTEEEKVKFSSWLNEDEAHTQQWTDALDVGTRLARNSTRTSSRMQKQPGLS
jgi:ferric-dicitrate binding protein FerR (iron transport regulator)